MFINLTINYPWIKVKKKKRKLKRKTYQNMCNTSKVVLRGKLIVLAACIRKEEKFCINNLRLYLN